MSEDELVPDQKTKTPETTEATAASAALASTAAPHAEPEAMPAGAPWQKQIVKQVISLSIAVLFLWISFKNVNMGQVWLRMQTLNPVWVLALCASAILSHYIRAVRWTIMLQPLADKDPRRDPNNKRISIWNSFCAVMIGYAINIPLPRGGEVARVVSISKTERIPWAGVLPTMLIDRLLDFAMLVLLIGVTLVLLPPEIKDQVRWLVPAGQALCGATLVGLLCLPKMSAIMRFILAMKLVNNAIPEKFRGKVAALTDQFEEGTACLANPIAFPAIGALTFAMWFFYWLNMEFMVYAFDMQKIVDPVRCLMVFAIGSVGVIVPTPGSAGSYHLAASQALHMVAGVDQTQAMAFVTAFHAISFVFIACIVAAICVMVQSMTRKRQAS